jgi:hypothetical protein
MDHFGDIGGVIAHGSRSGSICSITSTSAVASKPAMRSSR